MPDHDVVGGTHPAALGCPRRGGEALYIREILTVWLWHRPEGCHRLVDFRLAPNFKHRLLAQRTVGNLHTDHKANDDFATASSYMPSGGSASTANGIFDNNLLEGDPLSCVGEVSA